MTDGGRDAYRGFNYQMWVTVWLTLDACAAGSFDGLEVEPLGGEDAAFLARDPDDNRSERGVTIKTTSLVVQVKARARGHWTAGDLLGVLQGSAKSDAADTTTSPPASATVSRIRPLTALATTPTMRFLFVTTKQLADTISALAVKTSGFKPRDVSLDVEKAWDPVPTEARRRIGVLEELNLEIVESRIDNLLRRHFKVPSSRRQACTKALVDRVREGLLHQHRAVIDAKEVSRVAKDHGGEPSGPSVFVPPSTFNDLEQQLARDYALIVLGPAGIGKTTAARGLAHAYARAAEPFVVVYPQHPRDLEDAARAEDAVLALVDDPFEATQDQGRAREWTLAIHRFASARNPNRRLIVTSRRELLPPRPRDRVRPDVAADFLHEHVATIAEDAYNGRALLREHIAAAKDGHLGAEWLSAYDDRICGELGLPLDFATLVEKASRVADEQRGPDHLRCLIREIKESTLTRDMERAFADARDPQLLGLSIVWLALDARQATLEQLKMMECDLRDERAEVILAEEKLLRFGWLDRAEDGHLWTNSARMAGIDGILKQRPALHALGAEAALVGAVRRADRDLVLALRRATQKWLRLRQDSAQMLGSALRAWVVDTSRASIPPAPGTVAAGEEGGVARKSARRFSELLAQLAADGLPADALTLLARAFVDLGSDQSDGQFATIGFASWEPPDWDEALRRQVMAEPDAAVITRAFVRHDLPTLPEMCSGADACVEFLYGFVDLSADFDDAVTRIDQVPTFAAEVIARGAVRSKNARLDALLACARNLVAAADAWCESAGVDIDEDSHEALEHFGELHYDKVRGARALIDAVLDAYAARRSAEWAKGGSTREVLDRYAERVSHRGEADPRAIRRVVLELTLKGGACVLRAAARRSELTEMVLDLISHASVDSWGEIAETLLKNQESFADDDEGARKRREARVRGSIGSAVVALASVDRIVAIHAIRKRAALASWVEALLVECPAQDQGVLQALAGSSVEHQAISIEVLDAIRDGKSLVAPDALRALVRLGRDIQPWLEWLSDEDPRRALAAVEAAQSLAPAHRAPLLRAGLSHARADVRKAALRGLARVDQDTESSAAIQRLAETDPTTSVRREAVASLARNTSTVVQRALVALLADSTDTSEDARWGYTPEQEDVAPSHEYGIAIAAAEALAAHAPLSADIRSDVSAFLRTDGATARDATVRADLERALS